MNAGSLRVDGVVEASSITVSGGTLGGAGSVLSTALVSTNGRLAPGNLISGTAIIVFDGELTLRGTAVMDVNKTAGALSGDMVQGFGTLNYGAHCNWR